MPFSCNWLNKDLIIVSIEKEKPVRCSIKSANIFGSSWLWSKLFTSSPAGSVTLLILIAGKSCFKVTVCFAVAASPAGSALSIKIISSSCG
jgi:hypothetical protein